MRTGNSGDPRIDEKLASARDNSKAEFNVVAFLRFLGAAPAIGEIVIREYMDERTDQESVQAMLEMYRDRNRFGIKK